MEEKNMERRKIAIKFFTPVFEGSNEHLFFGGCTFGFAEETRWVLPTEAGCTDFPIDLEGIVLTGAMTDVKKSMRALQKKEDVKGGILLFGKGGNERDFVDFTAEVFPGVPFAGGSAAKLDDEMYGRVLPQEAEVSLLLITDDGYDIHAEGKNIHRTELARAKAVFSSRRKIDALILEDGKRMSCYDFLLLLAAEKGITTNICEFISAGTLDNFNIHLKVKGEECFCGADLPENGEICFRYVSREDAAAQMRDFYNCCNAIVFGCAGLKSLLDGEAVRTGAGSAGLFMFGEVVHMEKKISFANLMLSKLVFIKKH